MEEAFGIDGEKTIIRRISKRLPMSIDLKQVIHRDDEMFEFDNQPKPVNTAFDTMFRITRLGAHIYELRRRGMNIAAERKRNPKADTWFVEYYIVG